MLLNIPTLFEFEADTTNCNDPIEQLVNSGAFENKFMFHTSSTQHKALIDQDLES